MTEQTGIETIIPSHNSLIIWSYNFLKKHKAPHFIIVVPVCQLGLLEREWILNSIIHPPQPTQPIAICSNIFAFVPKYLTDEYMDFRVICQIQNDEVK